MNLFCTENIDEPNQTDPEKASALRAKIEFPSEPVHITIRNDPNGPYFKIKEEMNIIKWRNLNLFCTENIDELNQTDPEKTSALRAKIEFPSEPVNIAIRNDPNGPYNIHSHQVAKF